MCLCLFFWTVLSMSFIFYTFAKLYGYGNWVGVDSDNFAIVAILSFFLFCVSYITHNEQLSHNKILDNLGECTKSKTTVSQTI